MAKLTVRLTRGQDPAAAAKAPSSKRRTWIAVTVALCTGIGVGSGGTSMSDGF